MSGRVQILGLRKPSKEVDFFSKGTEGFNAGKRHNMIALLNNSLGCCIKDELQACAWQKSRIRRLVSVPGER